MSKTATPTLPGRLGNPAMDLSTDPRADPRVVAALKAFGMDKEAQVPPFKRGDDLEKIGEFFVEAAKGFGGMFSALFAGLEEIKGVDRSVKEIDGLDGNKLNLHIASPTGLSTPAPCIIHFHGGGGVLNDPTSPQYARHRDQLASRGAVAVSVDYRKSNHQGKHAFPAHLNDCVAAVNYVSDNKAALNVSHIVLSGESFGATLAVTTGMKLKTLGKIDRVSGIYGTSPFVSNVWDQVESKEALEFPSLYELSGYFVAGQMMGLMGAMTSRGGNDRNPLLWPLWASEDDLKGLPPTNLLMAELDCCRDEGLALSRKLRKAGVLGTGNVLAGVIHGWEIYGEASCPDVVNQVADSIVSFAKSVAPK